MNGQWLGSRAIRANWATRKPNPPVENKCKYSTVTVSAIAICCFFMCACVCVVVSVGVLFAPGPAPPLPLFSPTLLFPPTHPSIELT